MEADDIYPATFTCKMLLNQSLVLFMLLEYVCFLCIEEFSCYPYFISVELLSDILK
jgi:hypothetical protein